MKTKNNNYIWILTTWIGLITLPILGQEKMTVDDAIAIALKHNFDIQIAQNNQEQAANNKSIYNSGYLPTVSASGGLNYANNNSKLTSQTGEVTELTGLVNKSYNSAVTLNYLLYNGGLRKYSYEQLKEQLDLASTQKKVQIENTLIEVYTAFFNVARNQEQKNTLLEAYSISKERLDRVTAQQKYGQKNKLDVLNARVDTNNDSINLLNASVLLKNNTRTLNYLLGRELTQPVKASKEVILEKTLIYEQLLDALKSNNNELKQAEINKSLTELNLKISKAGWLPSVSTNIGYNQNYNDNGAAGFFAIQQSNGFNAGLSLSWNLFDGGTTKTKVKNAQIAIKTQELNQQKLSLNLENQLSNYWDEYTTQKIILKNEELNVEISKQNFLKSKEQFNLGSISSLQFREAQLNLINTQLNLLNAKYNAKIAEMQLKKFAGLLQN